MIRYSLLNNNTAKHLRERINNQIRATELRVIDHLDEKRGVMSTKDALALAQSLGLDLIEIAPQAVPPVAKIMEYGKFQYEQNKKQKRFVQVQSKLKQKLFRSKLLQVIMISLLRRKRLQNGSKKVIVLK